MRAKPYSLADINDFVDQEIWLSDWIEVSQARIDQFADCTEDHQWIHVDQSRAQKESPSGTTIAHGYLTLSLLSYLSTGVIPEGVSQTINYGIGKVRFMTPVPSGARIRNRVILQSVEDRRQGRVLIQLKHTVEIENEKRPALVGETLALLLP